MGISEDVKKMREDNISEADIISTMQNRGFSQKEISEALSQAKIKEAVTGAVQEAPEQTRAAKPSGFEGMTPSMMAQEAETAPQAPEAQSYAYPEYSPAPAAYPAEAYPAEAQTQQYAAYQPVGLSSDTITEISEQVVLEKLSPIKTQLEKVLDLKAALESRMEYLDERIKRIEGIIDRLQLSVLQKVGEYTTGIEDIKKELTETQKSFKSLLPEGHSGGAVSKKRSSSVV